MNTKDQTNNATVNKKFFLSAVLFAFAVGVFAGGGFMAMTNSGQTEKTAYDERDETFKFIRDAIANKSEAHHVNRELAPFRYKVKALIDDKIGRNDAKTVSVYFRDLNNGNWFGIGEKEKFSPKSLLKLPLMIAYFKWAETNPLVLRKRLAYDGRGYSGAEPPEKTGLEPGIQYTVNDLIFKMITEDDTEAYTLLLANIPPRRIDTVFKDLNVEYDPHKEEEFLSLRAFAPFYRVLFNASYLNEEMSEKALRYLSKSGLKHGMSSGIPLNVEIASKFGERTVKTNDGAKDVELEQMHEFAIIYHPRRPFLIGIMARGDDAKSLTKIIREITSLVYEEVDRQS